MPRPRPFTGLSTARPAQHDSSQLTPRTPLTASGSRTSRAEQGFAKLQVTDADQDDDDDAPEFDHSTTTRHDTLQSAPLLASSQTARFTARSRRAASTKTPSTTTNGQRRDLAYFMSLVFSRIPLAIGVLLALILLILIILSFTKPEELHRYIGAKRPQNSSPSSSSSSTHTALEHKESLKVAAAAHASTHNAGHTTNSKTPLHIISYENYTSFPLKPSEFVAECAKLNSGFMSHGDYWDIGKMGDMDVLHPDDDRDDGKGPKTCSSTITYMLDGTVGLTADLALVAQVAALARERNRTFFVDDRNWNRGKWTEHFEDVRRLQPGPEPGCKPPPPNELVACPRTARHWVVTSHTARYHFGHGFSDHYENPYAHELNRLYPIFDSARQSFDSTIRPNAHTEELIGLARQELAAFSRQISSPPSSSSTSSASDNSDGESGARYVAVHIRRGDRKPASFSFPNQQIPIEDYVKAGADVWSRVLKLDNNASTTPSESTTPIPVYYVASDSREAERQFAANLKEGETFSLFTARDARLRKLASPGEYFQKKFTETFSLEKRVLATRGTLVDLALISGLWARKEDVVPEAVVCSISTNFCRLAPIGLGWTRAFGNVDSMGVMDRENKRWIEIDLRGNVIPVWTAFELF